MKRIKDIRFIFIAVVLTVAMACGQNADRQQSRARKWNPPPRKPLTIWWTRGILRQLRRHIADYMDEATAKQFQADE